MAILQEGARMAMIEVSALTRVFRRPAKDPGLKGALRHLVNPHHTVVTAVDDVSFSIEEGESVAYLGPNGAGKSTTIKLLTGILVPTAGQVRVCGLTPHRERTRNARNISVMFGQRTQLWWDIPVIESLRLLGDIYRLPADDYRSSIDALTDVLELSPLLGVPARQLSLGQRTRCDLAAALLHQPRVLFLDEPTIGLDVAVKARMREFVGLMQRERGVTLVLTSHDLGDVDALCSRIVMIDKGRIVHDGSLAEVQRRFGGEKTVVISLAEPDPHAEATLKERLAPFGATVNASGTEIAISFDARVVVVGDVIRETVLTLPVADLTIKEPDAELIVRHLYEGRLTLGTAPEDAQPKKPS